MFGYYEWVTFPRTDVWSALESPERLADMARQRNQADRDLLTDRRGLAPQTLARPSRFRDGAHHLDELTIHDLGTRDRTGPPSL
jgi:hypothetical protein